jgi:hypothetical protein
METVTRLYVEHSSGIVLVGSVAVAREEVRLPERKKRSVSDSMARKRTVWEPLAFFTLPTTPFATLCA